MSLQANRFNQSANSILTLQGLTLEAAIQEAEECKCYECESRENITTLTLNENTHNICTSCAEKQSYWTCTFCEEYFGGNNGSALCSRCTIEYYCECGEVVTSPEDFCSSCYERKQKELIRPYSYKPLPIFIGKGPLYLGIELEVLADLQTASILKIVSSYKAYLKSDSSINGDGFEIVTHPMSLNKQLNFWEEVLVLKKANIYPHSSCGMHVHVSRKPLSQLQIGKILVFLNNPENNHWVDKIAGRYENTYCFRNEKTLGDVNCPTSRYEALNLTNDSTIEFRVFSSTNKYEEIASRIEFCHALTKYCENAELDELEWDYFMKWLYIDSPKELYFHLKEWIEVTEE